MSKKILHVRVFEQKELTALKDAIHKKLQVAKNVRQNTCICCNRCEAEGTHYSPEGLTEYNRTGICEHCWDVLVDESKTEDNPRFEKLTPSGVAVEESASTTSGTFSSQQLSRKEKSEEGDEADARSLTTSNHDAQPHGPVPDNKDHPDIGDSILTLYSQTLNNILAQKQHILVVGTKTRPKCIWLASEGCIKARATIEQVRRIDGQEFHELYNQHLQLDPPDSQNFYALAITNVRRTNINFNYYQLMPPSLFTRYRTGPDDLCPISRSYRKRKEAEEYAQRQLALPVQDEQHQPTLPIEDAPNPEATAPAKVGRDETKNHDEKGLIWFGHNQLLHGRAYITHTEKLSVTTFRQMQHQHGLSTHVLPYQRTHALHMADIKRMRSPQPFFHPRGAVGWVRYRNRHQAGAPQTQRIQLEVASSAPRNRRRPPKQVSDNQNEATTSAASPQRSQNESEPQDGHRTSSTSVLVAIVLPIVITSLLEHLDAWALQDFLQASKSTHDAMQHQSLRKSAQALRWTLEILTFDIHLPGLPSVYSIKLIPQHLLDRKLLHHSCGTSVKTLTNSTAANPTGHSSRHMQELLRQGRASTFAELVRKTNPSWRHDAQFQAFLYFLDDAHTTISYMPQFSKSEYHFRDIISPARLQLSFRYQNHAGQSGREQLSTQHPHGFHDDTRLTQFHDVRIPTPPAPQFHIQTPDSLQTQVESLVKIMFDPTAHSIIADEQVRHWQLYLQNKTYADPYYTFPNHFIHNCIFHFDVALHREVKSFIELSIHHIQEDQEQQPNTKLIAWQRNLRFRCKIQPFAFSTWQQLIYDVEFDDLANSVGFTYRQKQH
ncbi:unnamed protein product, partial [Symbiodinium sp. CCMP2592]